MSYFIHGHSVGNGSRTYKSWTQMLQRCENKNDPSYARYGALRIKVCEQWHDFGNFLSDMGERPIGRSLDRKCRHGDYEPSNCRWATAKEQQNNLSSNVRLGHDGAERTLAEWARTLSISYAVLKQRHRSGDRPPRLFRPVEAKFGNRRLVLA